MLYSRETVSYYRMLLLMSFEAHDVERKVFSILKVLSNSQESLGARVIARCLKGMGIELGERAVRYHLKLMDERGLTQLVGRRDGRVITELGLEELKRALVADKVGFAISRIEQLTFQTSFDWDKRTGYIPVNVSFFRKDSFKKALQVMKPIFKAGLCVSDLVDVAGEGESIGEIVVPQGEVGLATVCSVVVNGALLKAGVPMDSRFGGILQIRNQQGLRFAELIHYAGSSLDPSEVFIRANMTSVAQAAENGNGEILANFREIPAMCRPVAEEVAQKLEGAGLGGLFLMGNISEPICEISVDLNRVGIILIGGLNPVAAAHEAGIESENHAMSVLVEYQDLVKVDSI
jgi:repressor of nif and glnA expression